MTANRDIRLWFPTINSLNRGKFFPTTQYASTTAHTRLHLYSVCCSEYSVCCSDVSTQVHLGFKYKFWGLSKHIGLEGTQTKPHLCEFPLFSFAFSSDFNPDHLSVVKGPMLNHWEYRDVGGNGSTNQYHHYILYFKGSWNWGSKRLHCR